MTLFAPTSGDSDDSGDDLWGLRDSSGDKALDEDEAADDDGWLTEIAAVLSENTAQEIAADTEVAFSMYTPLAPVRVLALVTGRVRRPAPEVEPVVVTLPLVPLLFWCRSRRSTSARTRVGFSTASAVLVQLIAPEFLEDVAALVVPLAEAAVLRPSGRRGRGRGRGGARGAASSGLDPAASADADHEAEAPATVTRKQASVACARAVRSERTRAKKRAERAAKGDQDAQQDVSELTVETGKCKPTNPVTFSSFVLAAEANPKWETIRRYGKRPPGVFKASFQQTPQDPPKPESSPEGVSHLGFASARYEEHRREFRFSD